MEYEITSNMITPGYKNDQGIFIQTGEPTLKYYVKYYGGLMDGQTEFYGVDLNNPITELREGYIKKLNKDDINEYKKSIIDKIDKISQNKIFEGFIFNNHKFSLSISAQINWNNLLFLPENMFPINLSTKDDDIYILTYQNVQSFYGAALNGKNQPLQEGNTLKQQLKSLNTREEINQFILDNNL